MPFERATLRQSLHRMHEVLEMHYPNGNAIFHEVLNIQTLYYVLVDESPVEGAALIRLEFDGNQEERKVVITDIEKAEGGWLVEITPTY